MSGFITPSVLDQIRGANEIVEVIGAVVPLKRAGANFVALCPFHKEKSPSFSVNPQKQIFYCFGCHKGGDVFRFIQDYESLTFVESVKRLADRARIPLEFGAAADAPQKQLRDTLLQIHEQVAARWHQGLLTEARAQIARDYLAKRSISPEAIKLFRLGYAPDDWEDSVNWARSKKLDLEVVLQSGLIAKKEGDDRYYGRFRGRLMFPICDDQGRVIGFSGRVLSGDEKTAKYVNSPETLLFHKGRVIFGLDKAKRALLDTRCAVICEGQFDLIACHMAGVVNAVAPQGTALTADQMRLLKRYVEEVVLCFDADAAGVKATIRALDDLLKSGLSVRVATLPAPHDPDSFIRKHGRDEFQRRIDAAEGFFDFYLKHLCQSEDIGQDKGRLKVVREMGRALQKAASPVLTDTYAQKLAFRLGVGTEAIRAEFRKGPDPTQHWGADQPLADAVELARPPVQEFWLLKLLFAEDRLVQMAHGRLELAWLSNPSVRAIITLLFKKHEEGECISVPSLLGQIEDQETRRVANEAAVDDRDLPNRDQQLTDCIRGLRDRYIDREMMALNARLGSAPTDQMSAIQTQQARLLALKRSPV